MNRRIGSTACVALAAVTAGLLFVPVFGVSPLIVPVVAPAVAVFATALCCDRRATLADWRPVLTAVAGVLTVVETVLRSTTVLGLPTGRTLRALRDGVAGSWQLTLQSTWPARPDPALLLFVPLLVVAAAVFGVEVLRRTAAPLPALLPSLLVLVLSQFYAALTPGPAVAVALLYVALAGALLGGGRTAGLARTVGQAAPAALAVVGVALLLPTSPAPRSLRQQQSVPVDGARIASPLDEISDRLRDPGTRVFRYHGPASVSRWPVAVLDTFDGVNWTPGEKFRRFGTELSPGPSVTVRASRLEATVDVDDAGGRLLPSQTWPASVTGVDPLVAERLGTLLLVEPAGSVRYTLRWWEPQVAGDLRTAAIDPAAIDPGTVGGRGGIGVVPTRVADLAADAAGKEPPSLRTALRLEAFLRTNYTHLTTGPNLPTGHGWPKLTEFLLTTRQGTSEQFAAGYVVLARILNIPARLAVGYTAPPKPDPDGWYTIDNGDVLAWPEVAVRGVGWVPLDPTGTAAPAIGAGLAAKVDQAREQLSAQAPAGSPAPGTARRGAPARDRRSASWWLLLAGVPVAAAGPAVPAAWAVRSRRRRRRAGRAAVVGAWLEVRDRLRAHGVAVSPSMTVRDLAAAATTAGAGAAAEVRRLGPVVDRALWSAGTVDPRDAERAWTVVIAVRRELSGRGWRARLRATFDVRGLLPPRTRRRQGQSAPRIARKALSSAASPSVPRTAKQ